MFRMKLPQMAAGGLAAAVMAVYCLFTGGQASTVRAFLMFGIMLAGRMLRRSYDLLSGLALAGILILIQGPMEEGHYAVIPEKSVILSATIADRICYINMNRAFQEEALDVSESIQIYSVVNSLLDSCEADKVQLSVEGSMDGNLRSSMPLYTFYEKNDQLVVHEKEES